MQISWHGLSCFEIKTKTPAGEVVLVIDPYDNATGLRFPRTLEAAITMVSHDEIHANNTGAISGNPYLISSPGEYEVKGIFIYAISAPSKADSKDGQSQENLIFRIEAEGMSFAHLGSLDRELTSEELERLENIDLLMVPVGGGRVMTSKIASAVISQIEPRIIIPMAHTLPNLKERLAHVDEFCRQMGTCRREETSKFKITKKDLPEEDMLLVTLSR